MTSSTQVHTIVVPWRKVWAALPLLALISSPVLFVAPAAPARDLNSTVVSEGSPVVVVPDVALTLPAPRRIAPDRLLGSTPEQAAGKAPARIKGGVPGGSSPAILDTSGIPIRALEGYRAAAALVGASDPGCHIDWALLAAIGRVESNHARFGGNQLDSAGTARPGIIGLPLDGSSGTALIRDSDGGVLDGDTVYDRAVGPMQFIPSTWRVVGTDANGDGVKDPENMSDAATASAVYLCSGPGDLSQPGDLRSAILRYNASDAYAQTVTALAASYRLGVSALPASALASALAPASTAPRKPVAATSARAAKAAPTTAPASSKATGQPAVTTAKKTTIPTTPAPAQPTTTTPTPTATPTTTPATPSTTQPTSCAPTTTAGPTTSTAAPTTGTAAPTTAPTPCVTQTAATATPLTAQICTSTPPAVATCTTVSQVSTATTTSAA